MKDLGDDVWDPTLVYMRRSHRVGRFKGREHTLQAATKKAIEIADAPPLLVESLAWVMTPNTVATNFTTPSPYASSKSHLTVQERNFN
jgi:hypothetical protein